MTKKKEPTKIPFFTKDRKKNILLDAFSLGGSHIITIVGAGGKTSLMLTLGYAFSRLGYKTLLTTTTHIYPPSFPDEERFSDHPSITRLEREDIAALKDSFQHGNLTALGIPVQKNTSAAEVSPFPLDSFPALPPKKWGAPSLSFLREIADIPDIILCEGDGAKHLPLKLPRKQEPVFYPGTDTVLGVIGLSSLGKPASKTIFGLSESNFALPESLRQNPDFPVSQDLLFQIAVSPFGLKKQVFSENFHILFNQADLLCDFQLADMEKTARKLLEAGFSCQIVSLSDSHLYPLPPQKEKGSRLY